MEAAEKAISQHRGLAKAAKMKSADIEEKVCIHDELYHGCSRCPASILNNVCVDGGHEKHALRLDGRVWHFSEECKGQLDLDTTPGIVLCIHLLMTVLPSLTHLSIHPENLLAHSERSGVRPLHTAGETMRARAQKL